MLKISDLELMDSLISLQQLLREEAEQEGTDVDETLDEAIQTLICYLDR